MKTTDAITDAARLGRNLSNRGTNTIAASRIVSAVKAKRVSSAKCS